MLAVGRSAMRNRSSGQTLVLIIMFTAVGWAMGATFVHPTKIPTYAGQSADGRSIAVQLEDGKTYWITVPR